MTQLWYANRDAYHAAEACRELEAEYRLRQLVRGGSHAAWKHPADVRGVDGTDQALLDRGEPSLKAVTAARTRAAIAALEQRGRGQAGGGGALTSGDGSGSEALRQAEALLQAELSARGVQLARMVTSTG